MKQDPYIREFLVAVMILMGGLTTRAQKVDSIYFNLYTDSLKKGTYNYINVDGKMDNGRWLPLTAKDISFSATAGKFQENSLFVEKEFKDEKVTITATLKSNPAIQKTVTVFIKQKDDIEKLKTAEEIMKEMGQPGKKRKANE